MYFETNIRPNSDVLGFFASWKFFDSCTEDIRRQFRLKEEIANRAAAYMDTIRSEHKDCEIVAVHARRGDGTQNGIHYLLSSIAEYEGSDYQKYINKSMEIIESKNRKVKYLIFSGGARNNDNKEDIKWCRENMASLDALYCVDSDDKCFDDITDFAIMALCDHFIGAQCSTFGWWAAWLGVHPDKIVIMPMPHHYNPKAGIADDYYCPDWIRIDPKEL